MKEHCKRCEDEVDETEQTEGYCYDCYARLMPIKMLTSVKLKYEAAITTYPIPFNLHPLMRKIQDNLDGLLKELNEGI